MESEPIPWAWILPGLLTTLCLTAGVVGASSDHAVHADGGAGGWTAAGEVSIRAQAYLFAVPTSAEHRPEDSAWTFTAGSAQIREHTMTGPSAHALGFTAGTFVERRTVDSFHPDPSAWVVPPNEYLNNRTDGRYAFLIVEPLDPSQEGSTFQVSFSNGPVAASPTDRILFRPGSEADLPEAVASGGQAQGDTWTVVDRGRPNGVIAGDGGHGTVRLEGDFRLTVFDAAFVVEDEEGRTTFWTGMEWQEAGHRPLAAAGEARHVHAEAILRDAVLEYPLAGQPFQVNFAALYADVEGSVVLDGFEGTLRFAGERHRLWDGPLELGGARLGVHLVPDTEGSMFHALADGESQQASHAGRSIGRVEAQAVAGAAEGAPLPLLFFAGPFALAACAACAWRFRTSRRPPPALLVGRARSDLKEGRYRRAARRSARAMRQGPDLDAAMIHASSLLKRGRSEETVRFLEQTRRGLADPTGILTVLYSIGHLDCGRPERAMQELEAALRAHPDLREDLRGSRLESVALQHPLTRRFFVVRPDEGSLV